MILSINRLFEVYRQAQEPIQTSMLKQYNAITSFVSKLFAFFHGTVKSPEISHAKHWSRLELQEKYTLGHLFHYLEDRDLLNIKSTCKNMHELCIQSCLALSSKEIERKLILFSEKSNDVGLACEMAAFKTFCQQNQRFDVFHSRALFHILKAGNIDALRFLFSIERLYPKLDYLQRKDQKHAQEFLEIFIEICTREKDPAARVFYALKEACKNRCKQVSNTLLHLAREYINPKWIIYIIFATLREEKGSSFYSAMYILNVIKSTLTAKADQDFCNLISDYLYRINSTMSPEEDQELLDQIKICTKNGDLYIQELRKEFEKVLEFDLKKLIVSSPGEGYLQKINLNNLISYRIK